MHVFFYLLGFAFLFSSGALPQSATAPTAEGAVALAPPQEERAPAVRLWDAVTFEEAEPAQEQQGSVPAPATTPGPLTRVVERVRDVPVVSEILPQQEEYAESAAALSPQGILSETNLERTTRGMSAFSVDPQLTEMAERKLADMIARDYFQHESPTGDGIQELAAAAGYQYILVGENLAYGGFRDDAHVVEAWMESPGHRANILHEKYSEIGIAARRATFQGEVNWVAVQSFGLPRSVCPAPDQGLKEDIEEQDALLEVQQAELATRREDLEAAQPSGEAYIAKVEEYNTLVANYNELLARQRAHVEEYNDEAHAYNECLAEVAS